MRFSLMASFLIGVMSGPALAGDVPPPVTDDMYVQTRPAEVELGRLLFWDPVLSGNRNISCGTCHHPKFGTADGVSLSMGEGGIGLGPDRRGDPENLPEQRIPRNAPALFNLGAKEFTHMFHDGRLEADPSKKSGLRTPLDDEMVEGFSGVLSAQSMFPVLSPDEMAGHYSENDVAKAIRTGRITGEGGAWDIIARRVSAIPEYRTMFERVDPAYAGDKPITFIAISDAIAAFIAFEWRADQSPFDAHLRGTEPLSGSAALGMKLFYGDAGCSTCHSGAFQTDHAFHAMAEPQLGPGKAERFERHQKDIGRMRVTGRTEDAYAFRTPSLRNVTLTAPYGHAGADKDLASFLRHHADPVAGLAAYDPAGAVLAPLDQKKDDWALMSNPEEVKAISAAFKGTPVPLGDADLDALIAFLGALTDEKSAQGRLGVPDSVPSGLPVDK